MNPVARIPWATSTAQIEIAQCWWPEEFMLRGSLHFCTLKVRILKVLILCESAIVKQCYQRLDIKKNYFGKVKILVAVLFCVISAEIWNNVVECPITGRKKFLPLSDEQMAKYYKEFDDIQDADYEKQLSEMLGETCKIIGNFHFCLGITIYFENWLKYFLLSLFFTK